MHTRALEALCWPHLSVSEATVAVPNVSGALHVLNVCIELESGTIIRVVERCLLIYFPNPQGKMAKEPNVGISENQRGISGDHFI